MNKNHIIIFVILLIFLNGCTSYTNISKKSKNSPIITPYSSKSNMDFTLYYPDKSESRLIPKKVNIKHITKNVEEELIEKLITGIEDEDVTTILPKKTKVLSTEIADETLYLNLSKDIKNIDITPKNEALLLYSIVNTMTQLDNINNVQILLEGEREEIFVKYYRIGDPIIYSNIIVDYEYINPLDTIKVYYDSIKEDDYLKLVRLFKNKNKKDIMAIEMEYSKEKFKEYEILDYTLNNHGNSVLVNTSTEILGLDDNILEKSNVFSLVFDESQKKFKINEIYE